MIEFETIDKFINYIPNCIICGKKLTLYLNLFNESFFTRRQGYFHFIEMKHDDEFLISKNKLFNFSFDSKSNLIIDGINLFNESMKRNNQFLMKCKTCAFYTKAMCRAGAIKKYLYIPKIELYQVNIQYMLPKHKSFLIKNYLSLDSNDFNSSYITINEKSIGALPYIDLAKFSNIKQLNKRIKTLITFQ